MEQNAITRTCLTCNKIIRGRSDKKFCDDYCRSTFNNKYSITRYRLIRVITKLILKNRKILEKWDSKRENPVPLYDLLSDGLTLSYATEFIIQPIGNPHIYCFEYGYQLLPNNKCRILKKALVHN